MNPDGWVNGEPPMSKDEMNLQRFLDDLSRKAEETIQQSDYMRQVWKDALKDKEIWRDYESRRAKSNAMPSRCPACRGQGRITDFHQLTGTSVNTPCLWCEGSGAVVIVRERRVVE